MQPEPEPVEQGNMLTRKYGPLPGWGWLLVTALLVFAYLKYKQSKSSASSGGTSTGTGSSTGTSNALTSNLVGVSEPQPVLDGTYQITVSPENSPSPVYDSTSSSSTQGLPSYGGSASTLQSADPPVSSGTSVQPQTQSSSPQTQSSPTTG